MPQRQEQTKPSWAARSIVLITIVALASGAWWVFRGDDPPAWAPSTLVPPTVDLDEVNVWSEHLGQGGALRLVPDSSMSAAEAKSISGLGRLHGADESLARTSIQRVIDKHRASLDRHYKRPANAWPSAEERNLEEAELLLRDYVYAAYLDSFNRGSYYLCRGTDDKIPNPEGVIALNLGVTHEGTHVLLVVTARKADTRIPEAEAYVEAMRSRWLAKVAYDFNSKPDEAREALIRRWQKADPDDEKWRENAFPTGLIVQEHGWLVQAPR